MNIRELMQDIRKLDLVLPEFQREYVWSREQAKQLIVSLLRNYPTGSILLWKTDNPPEIKNNAVARERIGTTSVILDGQQRLTTLYLLTQDAVPPYYRPEDIRNDPRNLYFDIETGDLQFYQVQRMKNNPVWVPVTSCFDGTEIDVFQIAQRQAEDGDTPFQLANKYNKNLSNIRNIASRDYPVQTVPADARIDDAIDVFDRVNSQGTPLSAAELALAHMNGKWTQARPEMKRKMDELAKVRFQFDLTFMVRALTGVIRGRALFPTIHDASEEELKEGWKTLGKILDYLVAILPKWAHIHSTDDLNTTNVLIPPIVFLSRNGGSFASETEVRRFTRWLYAASVWARYSAQTDQKLDHDVSIVLQSVSPWTPLVNAIIDDRGRITLTAGDLEGKGAMHPLYRMTFILSKVEGAVDFYNGMPLDMTHGKAYRLHSHHIFPQSILYEEGGYSAENHVHKQKVNEIANRVFLTAESNLKLSDEPPVVTLTRVETKYPGALQKQFVPTNPKLWQIDQYEAFLQQRREMIAQAYNRQIEQLLEDLPLPEKRPLPQLIAAGESATLELKSTLRWDVRAGQVNKSLQKVIAKTVAGFMNTEGGTLLIGVADDGTVYGLESDMQSIQRKDCDGFEQALVAVLTTHLGAEFSPFYHPTFETIDGKTVCSVEVDHSPKAVWLKDNQSTEFYKRVGNSTQPLDPQTAHEYIEMHWGA